MKPDPQILRSKNKHKKSFNRSNQKMMIPASNDNAKIITPSVLMISTFPPTECGIATYANDLANSLDRAFGDSCLIKKCPIVTTSQAQSAEDASTSAFSLNTHDAKAYALLAKRIHNDDSIASVMIQHEFGLFQNTKYAFIKFLSALKKPVSICFHTVLPNPDNAFLDYVKQIVSKVEIIIVMTQSSRDILVNSYGVEKQQISLINHGTHLVEYKNKSVLKEKYGLANKTVLSTFGLLSPGKSIETTLDSLPGIVETNPDLMFLILGKTHPSLVKQEGEAYRDMLHSKVESLGLESHVKFVNTFLPLETLLEYLQLTDIYLFTSKDPNQAVSGTFSYAMSCGCPIISTPIPHAMEFLSENKGLLFDFEDSSDLSHKIKILLKDETYRKNLGLNGLHASSATSWENSAIAHGLLLEGLSENIKLKYQKPEIRFKHLFKMSTDVGVIQFSQLNQPDLESGYTLDDNARALIAVCELYRFDTSEILLEHVYKYASFILNCQRYDGRFLNYVDKNLQFTSQNEQVNLEDSNGRAIWALGHLLALRRKTSSKICDQLFHRANDAIEDFLKGAKQVNSPRAMAFIIKGISASKLYKTDSEKRALVTEIADKLSRMYEHESQKNWNWFEAYLTYGNSVLPEAMLDAYHITGKTLYRGIAQNSFDFLLNHLFRKDEFRVISNQTWFLRGDTPAKSAIGGEQPIDVAYTILALKIFHRQFPNAGYAEKMELAFSWFMGNNSLKRMLYNPCTNGCFDGLELSNVNLNQGAESTISYLLARLAFEEV